jgi:hypothetical protein
LRKREKKSLNLYLSITTVETSSNFLPFEGIYRMPLLGEILLRAPFSLANPLSATNRKQVFRVWCSGSCSHGRRRKDRVQRMGFDHTEDEEKSEFYAWVLITHQKINK